MNARSSVGAILMCATRVHVRSAFLLPVFAWHTTRCHRQARAAPGNLRTAARSTGLLDFWTVTAWRDDEALGAYLFGGAHGRVMARASDWFDEACVARWSATSPDADWPEIERWLLATARPVPVRRPRRAPT